MFTSRIKLACAAIIGVIATELILCTTLKYVVADTLDHINTVGWSQGFLLFRAACIIAILLGFVVIPVAGISYLLDRIQLRPHNQVAKSPRVVARIRKKLHEELLLRRIKTESAARRS